MAKKLTLSSKNKWIGGVCGGIAEYFNKDATIVRIIWIILTIITGLVPMIVIYLILWLVIPKK